MKTKRIKITIDNEYVEVDLELDDDIDGTDEELIAEYAMLVAYSSGALKIDVTDIPNSIDHYDEGLHQEKIMDTTLILYCAFSYLFMLGRITEIYNTNGGGFDKTGLAMLLLSPLFMPFYLGSK